MDKVFFDSWDSLIRTFVISIGAYIALILMLRVGGNRTLTQLNAFDFLVNVAIGSTLATVMLNKNVPLLDGMLAFFMLIGLQLALNYFNRRFKGFRKVIKTAPALLFFDGKFIKEQIDTHLLTEGELLQTVRASGFGSLEKIKAIVLETNGKFSIIPVSEAGDSGALRNVPGVG